MNDLDGSASHRSEQSSILIRQAESSDAKLLLSLIIALAEFEKLDPPDDAAQGRLIADAFGPRPRFDVFLAEVDGVVAGYAFTFETYSTFLARPTLYLEDLFVMPEFRGRQVGFELMKFLASESLRRGCGRLEWVVLDWNRHAIRFYERLGARHMSDWLPYRLDQETMENLSNTL